MNIHLRASKLGQLIDRCPACLEISNHLHCDLSGKGTDTLSCDPVVPCKDNDLWGVNLRARIAAPPAIPDCHLLKPPQSGRRLGQLAVAQLGSLQRGCIRFGGCRKGRVNIGKGLKLHDELCPPDQRIACCLPYPIDNGGDNRNIARMTHNFLHGNRPKLGDIAVAFALLSRLSLPFKPDYTRGAEAAWAYPLVGAAIGAIGMGLGGAALGLGLPLSVAGIIALAALILSTGAMHEDGLSDVADGFWGGWSVEDRLTIMKDSHVGVYGVIALTLSLLLRASLIITVLPQAPLALIAIAALSRAPMVVLMRFLPNPRATGLSRSVGTPSNVTTGGAAILACLITLGLIGPLSGLLVIGVAALAAFGLGLLAKAKIGGQTGDVLGASQQITEIVALATLAAVL